MEIEYWTPDDFVEGACAAADIGKEKPVAFDDDVVAAPSLDVPAGEEAPRRRGRPPSAGAQSRSVQESLRLAFQKLGGVDGLVQWGRTHPTEFYRLTGRLIPQEVKAALDVREMIIHHAFPPTPLDMHPNEAGILVAPRMVGDDPNIHAISAPAGDGEDAQQ